MKLILTFPIDPKNIPNVNTFISKANHSRYSGASYIKKLREQAKLIALSNPLDKAWKSWLSKMFVEVRIDVYYHDKRRRDVHNLFYKPILDGMTDAGIWPDDSVIKKLTIIECDPDKENPRIEIYID